MSENKPASHSNNVHSLKNKMSEDEWAKRQAAVEVGQAIDTGDHHTISGIFRKPEDDYPPNVRSINPKMSRNTQLDLSFKNELPRSIAATENKTDAVSQALHEAYKKLFDLYNKANEDYSPARVALSRASQNFYNEIKKYENPNTGAKIKNSEQEEEIQDNKIQNINAGKNIIDKIKTTLEGFTLDSRQVDIVNTVMPLASDLQTISARIQAHTTSLGQSNTQRT